MSKQKGFTLAELLIVVAIIAVLVAVGIPIFVSQMEKSREAVDLANIRSQYVLMMMDVISGDYDPSNDYRVDLKQVAAGWQSFEEDANPLKRLFHEVIGQPGKGGYATMKYDSAAGDKVTLVFDGGSNSVPVPDVPARQDVMGAAIYNYYSKNGTSGMTCWDSTYSTAHDGIGTVAAALNGAGADEIKAWTIINARANKSGDRFPYSNGSVLRQNQDPDYFKESEKTLYYLSTGVDISQSGMVGEKVPVLVTYTNDEGEKVYSVSDVTVTQGNSSSYNVISGNNPRPNNPNFDIDNLIKDNREDFSTDYAKAYAEYKKRLDAFQPPG